MRVNMKVFGVPVLLMCLLFLAVFDVKYIDAWWEDGAGHGNGNKQEQCLNFKEDTACSSTVDCGGGCDKILLKCDASTKKCSSVS